MTPSDALAILGFPEGANEAAIKEALQLKLDKWHKAGSFPGATMSLVLANGDRGGESFGLAVGFSDRRLKTPMNPRDWMLAGSVGKTVAAATVLPLQGYVCFATHANAHPKG